MQTEYIDERGYGQLRSDVAPRKPGSVHLEPYVPGATSLRDARPLYIGGDLVTAELVDRYITIFVGCKIIFQGTLPEEVDRYEVNSWVAQYAINPPEPTEVTVTLVWLADAIDDATQGWTRQGEQLGDVQVESASGLHLLREPESKAAIAVCSNLDLINMVAAYLWAYDVEVAEMVKHGRLDDLEEKLVSILVDSQKVMPQLKIMVQGEGMTFPPADCVR